MTCFIPCFTPRFIRRAAALVLAFSPALVLAEELSASGPLAEPAAKVYRQILPDGSIVYSDKPIKGAKIDETITPDPQTNTWTSESGKPPAVPPKVERTPVNKVPSIPEPGKPRTYDDANTDVIRAEMLLEDAKKRQEAGVEPLPGERTGIVSGKSRLNEAYQARQKALADEVAEAEAMLRKAIAERNTLRSAPPRR